MSERHSQTSDPAMEREQALPAPYLGDVSAGAGIVLRPGIGDGMRGGRTGAQITTVSDAVEARRVGGSERQGRLVVVSNRVADPDSDRRAGGLAVALGDVMRVNRGLWFGWSGVVHEEAASRSPRRRVSDNVDLATLDLTPAEYENYYLGYANRCLWPAHHFRADLIDYRRVFLDAYHAVNRRFAQVLSPLLRDRDTIWVHDYHLIPLGRELRRLGHRQAIGFFLHVPFPSPDVLAALPGHEAILRALVAYDLVGFQTRADVDRFCDCLVTLAGADPKSGGRITAFGNTIRVGAFPIGIDVDAFAELATRPAARRQAERLRRAVDGRALVIGVDRLDYSKGLPRRFEAYRRLLDRFPDQRNAVSFLQIAPPSRQELEPYAESRDELDRLSGSINGVYAELDWTPIRYHLQPLARPRLAGLYRTARVGLVTPLRDGMNLVAKEFVAAQDPEDPGVLVLSRFAGAAETMTDALIVNPYDPEETAEALHRALTMSSEERQARHRALLDRVRSDDVDTWRGRFLAALAAAVPSSADAGQPAGTSAVAALSASAEPERGGRHVRDGDH